MNAFLKKIKYTFIQRFSENPLLIYSPGRVNLIGEHTDYNKGYVLPAAIDKMMILAMAPNDQNIIRLNAVDMDSGYMEIPVVPTFKKSDTVWANYILGVVDQLSKAGHRIGGFDCVFGGNIPIGAGLSSSAALECGMVFGLSELYHLDLSSLEMAQIAMKAENQFVGVQCGIMDQFASIHGEKNRVIKLDCRSLEFERFPFEREDIRIMLCDTKVRRELAGTEYNIRRQQCEDGAAILRKYDPSVQTLRDVSFSLLEKHRNILDPVVYRRCRYVLEENQRVLDGCEDLLKQDFVAFGKQMYQSHYGLRDDYEVSCDELDLLVEASQPMDHILGARMMGGGFGGCTINLVLHENLEQTANELREAYSNQTGYSPDIYVTSIGEGTHVIKEMDGMHS
ncbi:MAG: galactokinase [Balneolales bacterium]